MKCPNCKKIYEPNLKRMRPELKVQDEYPRAAPWQREQLISGVCSDKCWDELFIMGGEEGGDEDERA